MNLFRKKPHKADEYFKYKLRDRRLSKEGYHIVAEAKRIRHSYPDLDGAQLVHLVYWGYVGD